MDNTGKLALFSVAALALIFLRRAVGSQAPIAETALERQVMRHKALIWRVAVKYDTDPAVIAAIMANESSGRDQPARPIRVTTYTGEPASDYVVGLMQVRVDTAKIYCDIWTAYDLQPNEANVECGVKYLRAMVDKFNALHLAVSAYNAGAGNVPWETSMVGGMHYVNIRYIRNVLGMVQRFRLLFMAYKGANVYMALFPSQKWRFEIP